eukprot:4390431-Pyramimonas_sp.AAC.1
MLLSTACWRSRRRAASCLRKEKSASPGLRGGGFKVRGGGFNGCSLPKALQWRRAERTLFTARVTFTFIYSSRTFPRPAHRPPPAGGGRHPAWC